MTRESMIPSPTRQDICDSNFWEELALLCHYSSLHGELRTQSSGSTLGRGIAAAEFQHFECVFLIEIFLQHEQVYMTRKIMNRTLLERSVSNPLVPIREDAVLSSSLRLISTFSSFHHVSSREGNASGAGRTSQFLSNYDQGEEKVRIVSLSSVLVVLSSLLFE
jgi:hypothetical protein